MGSIERGVEINERDFAAATRKLQILLTHRDKTGLSNKTRYKYLQQAIEQNSILTIRQLRARHREDQHPLP